MIATTLHTTRSPRSQTTGEIYPVHEGGANAKVHVPGETRTGKDSNSRWHIEWYSMKFIFWERLEVCVVGIWLST